MKYEFDALVFICRAQPLHRGHCAIIDEALKRAKEVIVVVGSSFAARNIRNPFTFEERKSMIESVYPDESSVMVSTFGHVQNTPRLKVVPVADYPYDDNKWVAAVQNVVHGAISWSADPVRIGLIGHEKDGSSFYLKIFPMWDNVSVPNVNGISATDIREKLFNYDPDWDVNVPCYDEIPDLPSHLFKEYQMIQKYKESWKAAPFPPTFITVDAVVVQSGHILLVKRNAMPGKGLWALPGGFLNQDERMLDGAIRELKEETKIKVPVPVLKGSIKSSYTFDSPYRSQRGRTITQAFFIDLGFDQKLPKVKGSDDAEKAFWMPLNGVTENRDKFFEDHAHIISFFTKIG